MLCSVYGNCVLYVACQMNDYPSLGLKGISLHNMNNASSSPYTVHTCINKLKGGNA